ncbi:MAG: His/Gly/Thr/Pro-type tRNA ligase C-terminal domain-containing protein [Minisyncoccia bacterium]
MIRETIPAEEVLSRAHSVGQYYGFTPLSTITAKMRGLPRVKKEYPDVPATLSLDSTAETIMSLLGQCRQTEPVPSQRQPLFVWHTNLAPGRPVQKKTTVQFHALGADRALADVVVIRALIALVRDLFHEDPVVRLNSMGDKETRARYARELGVFFRKNAGNHPEEYTTRAKDNVFDAAEFILAQGGAEDLPAPTEHLSDASRKRFEDLLEYLEMTETPYELARGLISRHNVWNDMCFELLIGGKRVAWGSHYNDLFRHFFPSSTSATGAILTIASSGALVKPVPQARIRFSFVHIGDEAKRISIRLAEDFRKARVPLSQYIGTESLTEQLGLAERDNNPYLLIVGRKEALEGSAILRNRATQVETLLPLSNLIERLKLVTV